MSYEGNEIGLNHGVMRLNEEIERCSTMFG